MREGMNIRQSWEAWTRRPFPGGIRGLEIEGVDLTLLDTLASGCIKTYVDAGYLDPERVDVLQGCMNDLDRTVSRLTGDASEYLVELQRLGRAVLAAVDGST